MSQPEKQRTVDKAEIKIRLIENGILVGAGPDGWFSFTKWEGQHGASEHIGARLERIAKERQEAPR